MSPSNKEFTNKIVVNYYIVSGNSIRRVNEEVTEKRNSGWHCVGGVSAVVISDLNPPNPSSRIYYSQAMEKFDTKEYIECGGA